MLCVCACISACYALFDERWLYQECLDEVRLFMMLLFFFLDNHDSRFQRIQIGSKSVPVRLPLAHRLCR